jgi:AcrR family transcriptional regulator
MRAVAERAQVSAPTAYQYFSSRDHILAELLAEINARTTEAITTRPSRRSDPVERTVATLRRAVQHIDSERVLFVALMRAYISGSPGVRRASGGMEDSMRLWIDSALGDCTLDARDDVVAILEAVMFSGMVSLVISPQSASDIGDTLERATRTLLRGSPRAS